MNSLPKIPRVNDSQVHELNRLLEQLTGKRKADNSSPKQDFKRRILESRLTSARKLPTPGMLKASRNPPKLIFVIKPEDLPPS
jgi:hypothetical protein